MSCAVFGGLVTVIVAGVLISSVCGAGDDVSFSGDVGSRRAVGIDLVVGGGRRAAVGSPAHSCSTTAADDQIDAYIEAEGAGCLLLSALLL